MTKIKKSESEWQKELTPEQFQVMRKAGTEPAFTGKYNKTNDPVMYVCAGCGQPLFSSEEKFDSGTGWPRLYKPLSGEAVEEHSEITHGMRRAEVRSSSSEAHLGNVFRDGPRPPGMR